MKRDHLSPTYTKAEEEDKTEVVVREIIRIETDWMLGLVVEIEDSLEVDPRFEQNYRGNSFWNNDRGYGRQNSRREYKNDRCDGYNRDQGQTKRESSQEVIAIIELEVQAVVDLDQDPEPVLIDIE